MVQPLAIALGFQFDPKASLPQAEQLPNGAQLYQLTLKDANRTLAIVVPLWSPITAPAKKSLCFDVNSTTELCPNKSAWTPYKRAYVNGLIKTQIMDDRLS